MKLDKIMKAGKKYIEDKNYRIKINALLGLYNRLSDEDYLKLVFKANVGQELNLNEPKTFNEKLQWLKIHDHNPQYTLLVDKYAVREYIKNKLGEEYLIPLLGVWDSPDSINFANLPNQFVLKCNHNSGLGMCICKDKEKLDIQRVKKELRKGLRQDYYLSGREWPYKNVQRKIIAEKFMVSQSTDEEGIKDYKFMCFNGHVKCSFVCSERFSKEGLKVTFFDRDWNILPFERHYPKSEKKIPKPQNYELMIEFAERLSKNIPFVRIDFYEIEGKIYFGEITFFPGSGLEEFTPVESDYMLGSWLELPIING